MNPRPALLSILAVVITASFLAGAADRPTPAPLPAAATRPVDFVADIQPIFQKHCLSCHGPEKQRSSYRLDARTIALRGGESGHAAILPGRSAESPLVRFIARQVPDMDMPPKGAGLAPDEIALVRAWIDQGAVWPAAASVDPEDASQWWSLQPLKATPPPESPGVRHPVDRFVRARLEEEKLSPSPEADRRTLIRRLSFDLLGLPPTPEDVAAFVKDTDPQAYEKLVDRLLDSPHYGERWARHWLDIVHYGDTQGYDKDKPRPNAWPYRDYVIRAFNEDKPYRQFVEEQLAGDVLYPHTADGIEALGFISAGPWDFIGHAELPETKTDGKIARHLDRDDMVANTTGTFVSLTVHCAQCHDHKFDPIPQEDYYRLQAVFAAVDRTERKYYRDPALNQKRSALEQQIRSLKRRSKELQDSIASHGGEPLKQIRDQIAAAEKAAKEGSPAEHGYHSAIASKPDETHWVQVDLGASHPLQEIALLPAHDDFNGIGAGFGFPKRFKIEASDDPTFSRDVRTLADKSAEDFPNPGIAAVRFPAPDDTRAQYVRVTASRLAPRQDDFIFALAELEVLSRPAGSNLARGAEVSALHSIEAPERWRKSNLTDGKAPKRPTDPAELESLKAKRDALIAEKVPADVRDSLAQANTALDEANKALEAMPAPLTTFVGAVHYGDGNFRGTGPDDGKPRLISLLSRGDVKKPIRPVTPGALRAVPAKKYPDLGDEPESARRAALARWIIDPSNPLTWRSIVNRAWQNHFGRGLVDTPNDFGRMGGRPSHPELLDWLAVEFRDHGQSFKQLDRLLVTSATYRQAAHRDTPPGKDADNRLLWRMNPRRLDAESVRDAVLSVAGRLDPKQYGPGFQDFVVEKPEHSPHYQYHLADPNDPRTHRRSIYRFLVRSQQEPFMVALDCADPSMRVDRRNETLSPLQALALLNSNLTVAMAAHFGSRVEAEAGPDPQARLDRAFQLALQRSPTPEESRRLAGYATSHGFAATGRLLLNLNEFVFID